MKFQKRFQPEKYLERFYPVLIGVALYFLITTLRKHKILNGYIVQVLMFAGINTIMTCSLNLINGFTGQFCIGHAGFMSLGAYGSAVITTLIFGSYGKPVFLCSSSSFFEGSFLWNQPL